MIRLTGLAEALARLSALDLPATKTAGLNAAATLLRDAVTGSLSHPPGTNPSLPALRTGALRASIRQAAQADRAVIASTSPIAVYQELGTARLPPRPFLSTAAHAHADDAARAFAAALIPDTSR